MLGLRLLLVTPDSAAQIARGALEWPWAVAGRRAIPIALMVMAQPLPAIGEVAARYPRMRMLLEHVSVSPFATMPDAVAHLDALLALKAPGQLSGCAPARPPAARAPA